MMQVLRIIEIAENTYALAVKLDDDSVHETVCRIADAEVAGEKTIKTFGFESDDFQRRVMKGEIDVRAVISAVEKLRTTKS